MIGGKNDLKVAKTILVTAFLASGLMLCVSANATTINATICFNNQVGNMDGDASASISTASGVSPMSIPTTKFNLTGHTQCYTWVGMTANIPDIGFLPGAKPGTYQISVTSPTVKSQDNKSTSGKCSSSVNLGFTSESGDLQAEHKIVVNITPSTNGTLPICSINLK